MNVERIRRRLDALEPVRESEPCPVLDMLKSDAGRETLCRWTKELNDMPQAEFEKLVKA